MKLIKAGRAAIKGLADATYRAASYVSKHEGSISCGVRSAIEATGRAVAKAGAAADQLGRQAEEQFKAQAVGSDARGHDGLTYRR